MTEDIDYNGIATWQDAVKAAHGDFTKAQEIWMQVKPKQQKKNEQGGSPNPDEEEEWISEQRELNDLLQKAGVKEKNRRKYIVDMFFNTVDFEKLNDPSYMNSILRISNISADKRRMVLMAWYHLDEREVNDIIRRNAKIPYSDPYSPATEYGYTPNEPQQKKSPVDIVDEQLTKDLEIKRKKLEMKRAMKEMEELQRELDKYDKEPEKEQTRVKVPLRDRYGNIVKDAEGNIVYVFINPQEEYERQKLEAQNPQPEQSDPTREIMIEMMKQQNEMMMTILQNNLSNKGGSEESEKQYQFMEKVLEQMKADKEQTAMTLQKLQQEIEKKKREELEERINELNNGLVEIYKSIKSEDKGPLGNLEQLRKLKQEYPEFFGRQSPEEAKLDMDTIALKNSFELMKRDHEMVAGTLEDIKDLYKQKLMNDIKIQGLKEEAELRKSGVPLGSPLTPDRLKKIENEIEQ